mgnify:CR=1 FL=1
MSRIGMRTGIALVAAVAAGLCCSAAAPASQDPVSNRPAADATGPAAPTTPVPDPAAAPASPGEPVCLPLAVCGCFNERRCVTARVQADGISVDILDGEHAGETGHLLQDCPTEGAAPADCVSYVDPAMICRRLRPADDNAAKYLCSMDDIHLDYRCGFVDGACGVL